MMISCSFASYTKRRKRCVGISVSWRDVLTNPHTDNHIWPLTRQIQQRAHWKISRRIICSMLAVLIDTVAWRDSSWEKSRWTSRRFTFSVNGIGAAAGWFRFERELLFNWLENCCSVWGLPWESIVLLVSDVSFFVEDIDGAGRLIAAGFENEFWFFIYEKRTRERERGREKKKRRFLFLSLRDSW